jgi:excisionase family DNA binding protein
MQVSCDDRVRLVEGGAVDVADACKFCGLGRTYLYDLMGRGQLRYTKVGKRRLIPRSELVRLLACGLVGVGQGASG